MRAHPLGILLRCICACKEDHAARNRNRLAHAEWVLYGMEPGSVTLKINNQQTLFFEPDTIVVLVSSIGGPLVTVLLVTVAAATSLPGERNIQVLAFRDLDGTLSSWHCDFVTL